MISAVAWRRGALVSDLPLETLREALAEPETIVWVDLSAPTPEEGRRVLADAFGFHPLAIEDALASRQQPKLEDYGEYVYMICHGVRAGSSADRFAVVELDVFLGRNFLVTAHDDPSRSIDEARDALVRRPDGLARGPAFLMHQILDAQADRYEPVLEQFGQRLEEMEGSVLRAQSNRQLAEILRLKRVLHGLRRSVARQTDVVLRLARRELAYVGKEEALLFRDVHDHLLRALEWIEGHREMLTSLVDLHLSVASQRLGEVMKFLTVLSTIMLPLTLIAGIYGMNFDAMPELRWRWGYSFALGLMATTTIAFLWFFRRRGWIGRPPRLPRGK